MAFYANVSYTGDGVTTDFTVTFPYIITSYVKVTLDNVLTTAYTWVNTSTIRFNAAPAAGVVVKFRRETPRDVRLVDFVDAGILTEVDLDAAMNQIYYVLQEALDDADPFVINDHLEESSEARNDAEAAQAAAETAQGLAETAQGLAEDAQADAEDALAAAEAVVATKMNITGDNLAIGSDANGDLYYRAAGVLARLAKGAANQKTFMNAGATAPEWAEGIAVGSFTRAMGDASGDVAYTGIGFKPSVLIFFTGWGPTGSNTWNYSVGMDNQTAHYAAWSVDVSAVGHTTCAIMLVESNTKYQKAVVKSKDADGFTLTWTLVGTTAAKTIDCGYIAIR